MCVIAYMLIVDVVLFFFKQKTAYEMRISDWSSDVCSSDLRARIRGMCLPHRPSAVRWSLTSAPAGTAAHAMRGGSRRHSDAAGHRNYAGQIGRASCRERVCQYV